jgi:hypothetical protein
MRLSRDACRSTGLPSLPLLVLELLLLLALLVLLRASPRAIRWNRVQGERQGEKKKKKERGDRSASGNSTPSADSPLNPDTSLSQTLSPDPLSQGVRPPTWERLAAVAVVRAATACTVSARSEGEGGGSSTSMGSQEKLELRARLACGRGALVEAG